MNCRQCKHWNGASGPNEEFDLEFWWPCAKGVASLPDSYFVLSQGKYGLVNVEYSQPLQKLPWLIDEHDCPEFEETEK